MDSRSSPSDRAIASFERAFAKGPEVIASAPGRVNIIGEHTDYNDGFVLPVALSVHTAVVASRRSDRAVSIVASDFSDATDRFSLDTQVSRQFDHEWKNHVRGMVSELLAQRPDLNGFNLAIAGNIPKGTGLSSSASLAVAIGTAVSALNSLAFDRMTIARLAQKSECNFVGTQCGIMDQLASACGQVGHVLLIDCNEQAIQPVRLPDSMAILIVQSGVVRELSEGRYNQRRQECEAAAKMLGVSTLRRAHLDQLADRRWGLSVTLADRARHVISENERTLGAVRALEAGDLEALGLLMAESHRSLRDDFAVSHPYVDQLAAIAQTAIGSHGGARMTGGGFGGAVVALMPHWKLTEVIEQIAKSYRDPLGNPPDMLIEHASAGATARSIASV